ncbi:MAG TPA: hypothetical protein VMU00_03680 [Steroidobacteraceae bacterium]|nr:hypothetical protein [Steroidobacteraceae bacterium]
MRITSLLLIVGVMAAASAAEPPAPAQPAQPAAAPATAAPAAAAPAAATPPAAAATAAVPPETLKKAIKLGLRPRQRQGTTMYCKDYASIGTRIPTEHCFGANDLDSVVQQMEEAQAQLRRSGACSANCGGT